MTEPDSRPSVPGDEAPAPSARPGTRGPISWMAKNSVAANLLMLVLILGGLLMLPSIKQEVFPEFELDVVVVNVIYPGASPSEVEQGVVLAIEEAVRGVNGVKEIRATASEGVAAIIVELTFGTNADRALSDIKSAVDRVTSFPQDTERPIVTLALNRREVISVVAYGDQSEHALRELGNRIRDGLLDKDNISTVELFGIRPLEISIEVPQEELRRYGLTLETIAAKVRSTSVELPGGGVKTERGEVLVRTTERRDRGAEFAEIIVLSRPDGSQVKLGDIARIKDAFRDTDQEAFFNGKRAVMLKVFRVGNEKPLDISATVKEYVEQHRAQMPPGVSLSIWADMAEIYRDRISLLARNGFYGFILVLLTLGAFLELRLAFWVTLGIPISFIGSLWLLPTVDASINMISLFAFIVTLGLVVDDAIVVGEAVYRRRTQGEPFLQAAINGAREVAVPVIFAVLTTMVAFAPMLFVPGVAGKFFRLIPIVVIGVLFVSLIESLLILPAHLAHSAAARSKGAFAFFHRQQQRVSRRVEWFVRAAYVPAVAATTRRRWLTMATGVAILLSAVGLVAGGRIDFTFMPKVDGDVIAADLRMPFGSSAEETRAVTQRLITAAQQVLDESGGRDKVGRGIFAQIGSSSSVMGGPPRVEAGGGGSHIAETAVFVVPLDQRDFSSAEFAKKWRQRVGEIAGVESLKYNFSTGMATGAAIDIQLIHRDMEVLEAAARDLAQRLGAYAGVYDIDDGFSAGKEQLDFKLKPEARALGVSEIEMARQVRGAFFGAEATRQQRGRDELRVYVRLPKAERRSEHDIERLLIRTPQGGEIPVNQAAVIERGRSYTEIERHDARRVVHVTAEVDPTVNNAGKVLADVQTGVLPDVLGKYAGLSHSLEGEQRMQRESLGSLQTGFLIALIGIFALLAVVFRSYIQPLIIMIVIPFGLVGAIVGHVIMGYELSLMSLMGIVALSGVVVNDSLILIVAINQYRQRMNRDQATVEGGARRFRPILLTSLTTFFGLMPMILETSMQARFLIPMAISLSFGVLFATFVTLLLVPAVYAVVDDAKQLLTRAIGALFGRTAQSDVVSEH